MTKNIQTKAIRNKQMAFKLARQGFQIIATRPNRREPEYKVYIFEVTPKFKEALDKLIEEKKG